MNKFKAVNTIIILCLVVMTSFSAHAITPSESDALCRQYAADEQVSQEDMDDYLESCIQTITDAESENDSSDKMNETNSD